MFVGHEIEMFTIFPLFIHVFSFINIILVLRASERREIELSRAKFCNEVEERFNCLC